MILFILFAVVSMGQTDQQWYCKPGKYLDQKTTTISSTVIFSSSTTTILKTTTKPVQSTTDFKTTTASQGTTTKSECGTWSEWSGNCNTDYCGLCNVQTRTRKNPTECTEPSSEYRQCLNHVCIYPCDACAVGCSAGINNKKHTCWSLQHNRSSIDGYWNWGNLPNDDPSSKICPSALKPVPTCGTWTEWSGECNPNYCGLCNSQTRTRTNLAGCENLPAGLQTDTRQCLNDVCFYPCLPCVSGCSKRGFQKQFVCSKTSVATKAGDGYENFTNVLRSSPKTCPAALRPCGVWSEWSGNCYENYCGYCNHQTRYRTNNEYCDGQFPGRQTQTRECNNDVCLYPCSACVPGCMKNVYPQNRFVCARVGAIKNPGDGFEHFTNTTRNYLKPCPDSIKNHG